MDLVSILLCAGGLVLVGTALFDALRTTISVSGGGPLTTRLAHGLWQGALHWHHRRRSSERPGSSSHHVLASIGTVVLLGIIVTWILLLGTGYFLLFSAEPTSVVSATTGVPADFWERVYFTGFTISTLGTGDFVPNGNAWRVLTDFAALSGLFVVTLSITYLVPVISAVVAKRHLAASIAGLGQTPEEILRSGWDGESLDSLEQPLVSLGSEIEMHAQRHLAYPVLHFFHSPQQHTSVSPSTAALSEALRLMQALPPEAQPPPAAVHTARSAIDSLLSTMHSSFMPTKEQMEAPPGRPAPEALRAMELPVAEDPDRVVDEDEERWRRHLLRAFLQNDGWTWEAVTHAE